MKRVFILLISVVSFFSLTFAAIQPLNGIAAVVNNDIIAQSALNSQVAMMQQQLQLANQTVPPEKQLRKQILDQMIDQKLVLQAAAKAKVTVSDAQLTQAIGSIAKQNHLTIPQLKQQIIKQGMNYSSYQQQLKQQFLVNLMERRIVGNTVTVSNAEVKMAMKKMPHPQTQDILQYHLQGILVPIPNAPNPSQIQLAQTTANTIMQQLQKGADFATVAISQATNAEPLQGGDMGWKDLNQLPPGIAGQLDDAAVGSIVGPVPTPNGFYIFKVIATRNVKPPQQTVTAQTESQVRQLVYFNKFQKAAKKWIDQLRSTSYIKIMNG